MIKDILLFFKHERVATLIMLIVLTFFVYAKFNVTQEAVDYRNSPALEQFKEAEENLKDQVSDAGSLVKFFQERPQIVLMLNLFAFIILGSLIAGVAVNLQWLFSPQFRQKIVRPFPLHETNWRFGMLFKVILYFIFGSLLISMFFEILKNLNWLEIPKNNYLLLHTTVADLMCLGFIAWVIKQRDGHLKDLGFHIPEKRPWRETRIGWTAYLGILPPFLFTLVVVVVFSHMMSYQPPSHPLVGIFLEEEKRSPMLVFYSIFLAVFIGPVLEEIFFRGFCYPILKQKVGRMGGMVLTAIFFALIHENAFAFFPIFVLGLGLNYIYEIRGSLFAPIVIHITHNSIFIGYFFLVKQIVLQEAG